MTDEIQTIPTPPSLPSAIISSSSAMSALALEVAKCLKLVAPVSMDSAAQLAWIASAVDALEDIRADEVRAISAELRRSVTRHNQIVPEIAKLVSEKRARASRLSSVEPSSKLWEIDREAQERRSKAHTQAEIEAAWQWERDARMAAGLYVKPLAPPLSRRELEQMPAHVRDLGIARGLLEYRDGQLVEVVLA